MWSKRRTPLERKFSLDIDAWQLVSEALQYWGQKSGTDLSRAGCVRAMSSCIGALDIRRQPRGGSAGGSEGSLHDVEWWFRVARCIRYGVHETQLVPDGSSASVLRTWHKSVRISFWH